MADKASQHAHMPDFSFPGPLEEVLPVPESVEGCVVIGCEKLEILSISNVARSMLCYKKLIPPEEWNTDPKPFSGKVFFLPTEQLHRLSSCECVGLDVQPRLWNDKYENMQMEWTCCPNYRCLILRITATAFGKRVRLTEQNFLEVAPRFRDL
jgi:hypothetical protein